MRHAFDKFEVPFDLIYKERIKEGNLRAAYDVILIPNQGRTGKGLVFDIESKGKPIRVHEDRSVPDARRLRRVDGHHRRHGPRRRRSSCRSSSQAGGVLITLGSASYFPAEFGLTRNVNASRPSAQFYAPGPIVEAEILKPTHPIFYGYTTKTIPVRYANGPLLSVPEADRERQVLMQFTGGDDAVLSGLMSGAAEIRNSPAIVDVPVGEGPGRAVRDQPVLPLAESRRVRHAVQRDPALQRHASDGKAWRDEQHDEHGRGHQMAGGASYAGSSTDRSNRSEVIDAEVIRALLRRATHYTASAPPKARS